MAEPEGTRGQDPPRVLSVQSHVVHGYVGNRSAVFPLQLLGFEVDVINSVQFSCHTGYPVIKGQKLGGEDLRTLVDGLAQNEVLNHDYLLTGYIGAVSFLDEVVQLLERLPKSCKYICDPVLGDNGHLYVPEELVDVYRAKVLPLVAVLTPNQFEAELLAECKISSIADAASACDTLHRLGAPIIVLTTLDVPDAIGESGDSVAMMLSEANGDKWLLRMHRIEGGPFTGTGDLFAAMSLAWRHFHPHEPALALEKAAAVLRGVIEGTVSKDKGRTIGGKSVPPELRLVSCKRVIENPDIKVRCALVASPEKQPKGVIFDLDGTLTLPGQMDFTGIRERTGIPAGADIVPFLREKHGENADGLAAAMEMINAEETRAFSPPQLQPGVKECLERLVSKGLRVGLVTRNSPLCVSMFLQHVGLPEGTFSPVVTRDSPMPNKPDPAPVLHCCQEWGLEPAEVLMVGDQVDDALMGKAAGSRTVAVLPTPKASPDALEVATDDLTKKLAETADFTLSSLDALRRLVLD